MLHPDISVREAKRFLAHRPLDSTTAVDDAIGPRGWTRRRFLQAVGAGAFGGAAIGSIADDFFGGDIPEAWAGTPIGPNDGILVIITMYGGNDGLNTVVPYGNGTYYSIRPNLAIPANQVLPIDGQHGFHPELGYLKQLWDAGKVAMLHGVGYADPDLSHFTSMAIWMNGKLGGGPAANGWIGRWLDGQPAASAELAVASVDTSVPLHLVGASRRGLAISPWGDMFGTGSEPEDHRMYDGMRAMSAAASGRGQWHDLYATTLRRQLDLASDVAPVFANDLPDGELTRKLTVAARLINANVGMRVIDVSFSGFDNHEGQPADHLALLRDLNTGLQYFYGTLAPELRQRVTLMTASEFGRTPQSNDSVGSDHGTSNVHFVIGNQVRGGAYGTPSSLTTLDGDDRLISTLDFRTMYGSVLDGWLGGGGSTILNGSFTNLNLFAAGPGDPPAGGSFPVIVVPTRSKASGYVPMTPLRVFDTRDGSGGRLGPLGPGETWSFSFSSAFAVPPDAVAAAINLTSVDATASTFVTVWPTGEARPLAANLNPMPGLAVPNLVVGRLGTNASINLYNLAGSVHLVADIVGYFRSDDYTGLEPLTPARLLDTRDGTGGISGPVGPGQTIDLQVAGRGGASDSATAVALNITVTEPTAGSYLTVFPTGKPRPLAASLNMVAGQTVPNMVLATVGDDGKISIFNYAGSTHVVADVLGWFGDGASSRYVALTPSRVLDTRDGTGAPVARVAQTPLTLSLAGRNGVPADGATGVLLNVTAVSPSKGTYLTVYPSGGDRPLAANLNAVAGQIVPNMVLGRLGTDGAVSIFNYAGDIDIVADVMGYFAS